MEDIGKKSLTSELENESNPDKIQSIIEDARLSGYDDVAEEGEKKLQIILGKVNEFVDKIEVTTNTNDGRVEELGGSLDGNVEVEKVDDDIETLKENTMEEIEKVKAMNKEVGQEVNINETEKIQETNSGNVEKSEEDLEAEMTNKLVDENIVAMNKELERIKNESFPEDLSKNLNQKKALYQEFKTKILAVDNKIKDFRENSPEGVAKNKAIEVNLEKMKEVEDFLIEKSIIFNNFDDKKILRISKKVSNFLVDEYKKEFKDEPDKLKEKIEEAEAISKMTPAEFRGVLREPALDGIISRYYGGSGEHQLETEKERLEKHKKEIKLATILTDSDQLFGSSDFEKELTKKVQEFDSAHHDLLEKSISYDKKLQLSGLKRELKEFNDSRTFIYTNGVKDIEDYVYLKRREIEKNTDLDLSEVSKTVRALDRDRYAFSNEDYYEKRKKFGLEKYNEGYIKVIKALDSWKEKLVKDYFGEEGK